MSAVLENAPSSEPLSRDHHRQYEEAHGRARPFRKLAGVAAFNGWVTGVIAAAAAPFALGGGVELLVVLGLAIVAFNEFRGRRLVQRLDPRAGRMLGWNQVGFLTMITVYCVWMVHCGLTGPSEIDKQLKEHPELGTLLGSPEELQRLHHLMIYGIYGLTLALSVVFQGLNAAYYFRSGRRLADHVEVTPAWILELQRTASR